MIERPTITTDRLVLRPHRLEDAPDIQRLIGDRAIADTTLNIPHPYEDGMAEEWIARRQDSSEKGSSVQFAIARRQEGNLIGGIGLGLDRPNESAELGYWVGKPFWNQGYCTEAARAVLKYGFDVLGLNRIYARHFTRNPASGRVMQKVGMKHEGTLRQDKKKWGKFEDFEFYGILRSEWREDNNQDTRNK